MVCDSVINHHRDSNFVAATSGRFFMVYPQAPIECDMYLKIPDGVETDQGSNKSHILKILKNIYVQK